MRWRYECRGRRRVGRRGRAPGAVVPHGFTVRGLRDPTHEQYFSLGSVEHFCTGRSNLQGWWTDGRFELEEADIVAGPPNEIEPVGLLGRIRRPISYAGNAVPKSATNRMPEIFEPLVVLTSRADIVWKLRVLEDGR